MAISLRTIPEGLDPDAFDERPEIAGNGLRIVHVGKQGVALVANLDDLRGAALENPSKVTGAGAMHGVDDDLDTGRIPITIGLRDCQRCQSCALREVRQKDRFLCVGAGIQNRVGREHRRGEIGRAKQRAAKLLRNDTKLDHAKSCAAILLRYMDARQ